MSKLSDEFSKVKPGVFEHYTRQVRFKKLKSGRYKVYDRFGWSYLAHGQTEAERVAVAHIGLGYYQQNSYQLRRVISRKW